MLKRILLSLPFILVTLLASLARPDLPPELLEAQYAGSDSQFMTVEGVRIHYRDEGSGPPLVLIHGIFSSLHTWQDWVELLEDEYRLLRLDLTGHGLTGPRPDGDYTRMADVDLIAAWLNQLGIDRVSLAGNSMGGDIAWRFALRYPDRVEKLILVDSAGLELDEHSGSPLVFRLLEFPVLKNLGALITPRFFFERSLREVYAQDDLITEALVDRYYLLMRRRGNRRALLERFNTRRSQPPGQLSELQTPTLILWGEQDQWIPVEAAYQFQAALPNAELAIIENTGHAPMEERPTETAQLVKEFLAR